MDLLTVVGIAIGTIILVNLGIYFGFKLGESAVSLPINDENKRVLQLSFILVIWAAITTVTLFYFLNKMSLQKVWLFFYLHLQLM